MAENKNMITLQNKKPQGFNMIVKTEDGESDQAMWIKGRSWFDLDEARFTPDVKAKIKSGYLRIRKGAVSL